MSKNREDEIVKLLQFVSNVPQFKAFMPMKFLESYEQALLNWLRIASALNANIIEYYILISATWIEASKRTLERIKDMDERDKEKVIKLWIDVFEKEFNTLLGSERFASIIGNITNAYADMLKSVMDLVEAHLKELGLPTRSEMDSVYREMVKMKRDIARLSEEISMLKIDKGNIKTNNIRNREE
jgi:hypothetical protein